MVKSPTRSGEIRERLQFWQSRADQPCRWDLECRYAAGGEAQRIRWPARSARAWSGCYISSTSLIGLHQRDNDRLLGTLKHLRDIGNTVIVVEHDEDAIRLADYVVDIGPGAGVHGGHIAVSRHPG